MQHKYNKNTVIVNNFNLKTKMKTTSNERIKELRLAIGISQTEFAYQTGISHSLLTKLEAGDNEPTAKLISKIVEKWNVSSEWLNTGKGELSFTAASKENDVPWKDEAYLELKKQNEKLWDMVQKFMSGEVSFLQLVKETA